MQCMDDVYDGVTVSDELRKMLVSEARHHETIPPRYHGAHGMECRTRGAADSLPPL